jgi:class 3 adenylate cyclase
MKPGTVPQYVRATAWQANLVGALVTYAYFRFIDYEAFGTRGVPGAGEIAYFVAGFGGLIALGIGLGVLWNRALSAPTPPPPGPAGDLARRRALQLPYFVAFVTLLGWVLAGGVWGIGWQMIAGTFTPAHSARMLFGITVVSGTAATALAFLIVERGWRRARLLLVLLLVAVIPISVLGMASFRGAKSALAAGPEAADVMTRMLAVVVFLVLATMATSIGLALSVSRSVAEPLGRLRAAMAEVERGRLDTRCPVVSSDFTPWVEASDPREVVRDLNAYFTEMETAIRTHGGLVVQYIGDEIEAVFGAPVARAGHAGQAVRAALEMRARLAAWNATRVRAGRPPLRNGIGIHTGTVLAGNIGSADRLSYALVGDAVNLASRLQGLTRELDADVLVSGTTRARLDGDPPLVSLPAVKVKGRVAEVEVYALG